MTEEVGCSGCSAQARSSSNKPTPPAGCGFVVNLSPMFLANSLPGEIFHPVPIALGEIRKLCQIDGSAGVADRELVRETRRHPLLRRATADTQTLSTACSASSLARGHVTPVAQCCRLDRLRPPKFEFLRPAVVIRRRPQRSHVSAGLALGPPEH